LQTTIDGRCLNGTVPAQQPDGRIEVQSSEFRGACGVVCGLAIATGVLMTVSVGGAELGFTVGELYVKPHPHLDFETIYNDNINISSANKQGDLSFVVRPGLQLQLGGAMESLASGLGGGFANPMASFFTGNELIPRQTHLSLDYTAAIERFLRLDQYDAINHSVDLSTSYDFDRLGFGLGYRFQDLTGGNITVGERVHSQVHSINFSADYRLNSMFSVGLHYNQESDRYLTSGGIDSQRYEVGSTFYYHMTSRTDLSAQYDHGWYTLSQGESAQYDEVWIGISGRLTGKTTGFVRIGYRHQGFDSSSSSFDTPVCSLGLRSQLLDRTWATVEVARSVAATINVVNNYYVTTRFGLTLNHALPNRNVTFSVGGAYEKYDYEYGTASSGLYSDVWTGTIGMGYNLTEWLHLGARYQYQLMQSNQTGGGANFDQNIVSLNAGVRF